MNKATQLVKAVRRIESDLQEVVAFPSAQTSVRKLARDIGVSPTTISLINHGHVPDFPTLVKITDWIGTTQQEK